ncbi:Hypothetical protein NTJ_15356 [Nesidiocoris tenuis]|uniref:C2H2-type domain-containing protein n=1 Tax=Nesidiocoris tenuis TaxID=355587 RepID=A0ABN7BDT6_9HEMI|nr:Hypothetical protein NTJ_15356 [Nesidiocoris tenuis]
MEEVNISEEDLNIEDLPSGYILIRKEDGMFAYLKMEPEDAGEVIEEGQIDDEHDGINVSMNSRTTKLRIVNGAVENLDSEPICEQEVIEDGEVVGDTHNLVSQNEEIFEGEIVEGEMEFSDILEDGVVDERTVTNDEVEFVDAQSIAARNPANRSKRKVRDDGTCPPQLWRGVAIPAGLTPDRIKLFKAGHLLQQLSDRVKLNRQKVEIYTRKNENLRKLITKQRQQMHSLGFHIRDITRSKPQRAEPLRSVSPEIDRSQMSEMEQIEYERKKLESHYNELRRQLKSLLSTYRISKKRFVRNHEKIQKGPTKRGLPSELVKKSEAQLETLVESDTDGESGNGDANLQRFSDCPLPESIDPQPFKCYHCSFQSDNKEDLEVHIGKHMQEMRYRCPDCNYFTSHITQFTKHTKLHPGLKAFNCRFCNFRSAHPAAMRNHELTHSLLKPYRCNVCDFRTTRSDHLQNHMRRHSDVKGFSCNMCDFKCKFPSGMTKHKKSFHSGEKPEERRADVAIKSEKESEDDEEETTEVEFNEDGTFVRITTLSREDRTKENSGKRKSDENIEDSDREMDDVVRKKSKVVEIEEEEEEEVEVEDGERSKDEDERSKGEGDEEIRKDENATSKGEVEEDVTSVGELDAGYFQSLRQLCAAPARDLLNSYVIYQCVFCHYSCEMKANLTGHMRSHMEKWSFLCKQCGYSATSPDDLRDHTDDHRNEGENSCPYCDHVAGDRQRLQRHVSKRHPPGVPMACVFCDYMCSNRPAMKKHISQYHRDKKQWQCVVCDFKAPFKSTLRRHLRKHTGERPYHCPLCEFNSAQYSHLTRHLRRFHPDEPEYLAERPCSPDNVLYDV